MDDLRRRRRLREIAVSLGAVLETDLPPLVATRGPSLSVPDDDRKADAILGQLKLERSASKSSPKGLRRLSSLARIPRSQEYSYDELYAALARVVEENGIAGVVEVLLKRFQTLEGDVNIARRASSGMIRRIRNLDDQGERGRLLETATSLRREDIVQLLCPYADQSALDKALAIAVEMKDLAITEFLLAFGMGEF